MLYLLDANILIDADRDYYPIGRVPEFWGWLFSLANNQNVKIPREIYEEVMRGKKSRTTEGEEELPNWLKKEMTQWCLMRILTENSLIEW